METYSSDILSEGAEEYFEEVSSQLTELSSDLREERFVQMTQTSEGVLQDTWYDHTHEVLKYWPGGTFENGFTDLFKEEEQVLHDFCEEEEFELLGIGTGRVVITPKDADVAFKVARYGVSARFGDGKEANQIEARRWQNIDENRLMPLYAASEEKSWLACPVAEMLNANEEADSEKIITEIKKDLRPYSDELCLRDIGEGNIGRIDEEWYWTDYGQPIIDESQLYGLVTELDNSPDNLDNNYNNS